VLTVNQRGRRGVGSVTFKRGGAGVIVRYHVSPDQNGLESHATGCKWGDRSSTTPRTAPNQGVGLQPKWLVEYTT
jgi:hypothetical protein